MSEIKFEIKIEAKPGGGYIARSPNPARFPDIEGETPEEVQRKVQEYFVKLMDEKLDQMHLGGLKATIHHKLEEQQANLKLPIASDGASLTMASETTPTSHVVFQKKVDVHLERPGSSPASTASNAQFVSSSSSSSGPIIMEPQGSGGTIAKIVIAIILAGLAMVWWRLHHG
jgi:hypothetical protein